MVSRRTALIAAAPLAAAAVWVASLTLVLGASWYLTCTVHGYPHTGIDCLQTAAVPRTQSEPAASIGFVPLAAAWCLATVALVVCALVPLVIRYRRAPGTPAGIAKPRA